MESFGMVAFCLSPFFVLSLVLAVIFRLLRHNEIVRYAEKGLPAPEKNPGDRGSDALRWGIVLAALGLALALGLWPIGALNPVYPLGVGPWMLVGFIPFFVGLGLVVVHVVSRPRAGQELPPA